MPPKPPTSGRTTLRDIARAAGVHFATVSRALQNSPLITAETRKRVQEIAKKMGYAPDPMLSGLAAYRVKNGKPRYQSTLAWITNHFARDGWRTDFSLYFQGASDRAAELGYRLEEFWLREPGMTPERLSQILRTRGISGLIIAPQPRAKMRIRLDWDNFSAVAMGYTLAWPRLHVLTNHQFGSMATTVRRVRAHGYRRVGLVIDQANDARINHGWTGGYLTMQQHWPEEEKIPAFVYEDFSPAKLRAWIKRHRPDAIIGLPWLGDAIKTLGYRIPEDIGVATCVLNATTAQQGYAGIDENFRVTGARAIDLVAGMIHLGERGIPEIPQRILTEGSWREGKTLLSHTGGKPPSADV